MDSVKSYLQTISAIPLAEKARLLTQGDSEIEFSTNRDVKIIFKVHDNQRNKIFAEIVQIESSFPAIWSKQSIRDAIAERNVNEPLGVYLHQPDSGLIIFRSTSHCKPEKYTEFLCYYLFNLSYGHLYSRDRFVDEIQSLPTKLNRF